MSYDMRLVNPETEKTIEVEHKHNEQGGTYAIGGTNYLDFNMTYNYSNILYREEVLGEHGIRSIYGKSGAVAITILEKACESLSKDVHEDYWAATEGNVRAALQSLIKLCHMAPNGIWEGD